MVNGVTDLAVTNLDGLDESDELQHLHGLPYLDGIEHPFPPAERVGLGYRAEPVYETHAGLERGHFSGCRTWDELPAECAGLPPTALASLVEAPVSYVGNRNRIASKPSFFEGRGRIRPHRIPRTAVNPAAAARLGFCISRFPAHTSPTPMPDEQP